MKAKYKAMAERREMDDNWCRILPNLYSSVIFQLLLQPVSPRGESPTRLVFLVRLLTSFDWYDLFRMKMENRMKWKGNGQFLGAQAKGNIYV